MKVLGIIPARGDSKGVPRKNIRPLAGKPLIAHTIDVARESDVFDRVVVSTDDREIADVARQIGGDVPFMRPAHLAEDTTPTLPVLIHAVEWLRENDGYEPDLVAILQPTTPLRKPEHLREALDIFRKFKPDSVVSMREVPGHYSPHWQFRLDTDSRATIFTGEPFERIVKRRQDLPKTYTRNGAVYLFKTKLLFEEQPTFYGSDVRGFVMDSDSSVNIDSESDFEQAERIVLRRRT